jgi:hypothetical protein
MEATQLAHSVSKPFASQKRAGIVFEHSVFPVACRCPKTIPDPRHRVFGPEATVRLTGVHLGGYNVWENQPGADFHGALDDFRIYRGLLIEDQIRTLANE